MPTNPGSTMQSARHATPAVWVATGVIMAGTVVGGVALIEWWWRLFWTGVGIFAAGWIVAWKLDIMDSTSEWKPTGSAERSRNQ